MKAFAGKTAVVTGAASGIGLALAEKCLSEGMQVVMADIETEALKRAAEKLSASGSNAVLPVQVDVAQEAELDRLADTAFSEFGGVHLLFNNAGIGGRGNSLNATRKDWEWVMGVNLWSVIDAQRIFVPRMIAQNEPGHVVNTASVAGLIGGISAGYSATKHAVVALTEALYGDLQQLGSQVGASVLCPGLINTNIMTGDRNRPDYVANDTPAEPVAPEVAARREAFRQALTQGMQPSEVADIVFDGIRAERLYILTDSNYDERIMARARNITTGTNPEPVTLK